ncbi:MAG: hypothetical protein CMF27_06730 [Kiritimatiellaceae bacterium]|nr:hypothetical protein [Kiritimatiellaceae bacterium]
MLIVAIPKSASSSLEHSIAKICKIKHHQTLFHTQPIPENCNKLHLYHSDVRTITNEQVDQFSSQKCIYKQHIFPSAENLHLLKKQPKIILLRPPEEIICSYYRAEKQHIHKQREEFKGFKSPEEWIEQAKKIGLLSDLNFFYEQWSAESKKYPQTHFLIHYSELISQSEKTLEATINFLGLPYKTKKMELLKKRYACNSIIKRYIRKIINN